MYTFINLLISFFSFETQSSHGRRAFTDEQQLYLKKVFNREIRRREIKTSTIRARYRTEKHFRIMMDNVTVEQIKDRLWTFARSYANNGTF